MSRAVTLVLITPSGELLGCLPPYEVPVPWWQEAGDVVAGARAAYGIGVTMLRLLASERPRPAGGAVTYLAEHDGGAPPGPLLPVEPELARLAHAPDPRRAAWAQAGGPAQTLGWAGAVLDRLGRPQTGPPAQRRAWNLSSIWQLSTAAGPVWIKEVPAFFAHEPAVLGWLAQAGPVRTPLLLGTDGGRMLLEHIPGVDAYHAEPAELAAMLDDLTTLQLASVSRLDELLALGVPDSRGAALADAVRAVVRQYGSLLAPAEQAELAVLVEGLAERMTALAACGIPDTLVHGDFHPGNVRVDGPDRTILDWGDSTVGHPGIDLIRLVDWPSGPDGGRAAAALRAQWCRSWRSAVPGCAPERALELLAPLVALRSAVVYARFVAHIEDTEQRFHLDDVPEGLRGALLTAPVDSGTD